MEWVETTAKTVEEAKNQALDQLGVAEDDAEIVVLDEPRAGLFGRVRGEARVRARVRPTTPRPKLDRRDRKKKDGRGRADKPEASDDAPATERAEAPARAAGAGRGGRAKAPAARAGQADALDAAFDTAFDDTAGQGAGDGGDDDTADEGAARSGAGTARRGRRGGRGGRGGSAGAARSSGDRDADGAGGAEAGSATADDEIEGTSTELRSGDAAREPRAPRAKRSGSDRDDRDGRGTGRSRQTARPASAEASDDEDRSNETMVDAAQVGDEARKFVQGVVDAFGLDGTASVRQDGDDLEVAVDGADLGLLVGPRGTTLQALQEITRVAAQRRLGDHDTRLRVDVGGYRERRKEALGRFAQQVAAQVVADGAAKRLEPMSSADRKVIHDVLATYDGVVTRSEGDDPRRCVVIAPAHD